MGAATEQHGLPITKCSRPGDEAALKVRFPDGENCHELCARLQRALVAVVSGCQEPSAVVVAHGASLRASVDYLMGVPEPGHDLGTGATARLDVTLSGAAGVQVRLLAWGRPEVPDLGPGRREHLRPAWRYTVSKMNMSKAQLAKA